MCLCVHVHARMCVCVCASMRGPGVSRRACVCGGADHTAGRHVCGGGCGGTIIITHKAFGNKSHTSL